MSVALRRLVALPEWQATVRVVAGADGMDREVRTVRPTLGLSTDLDVQAGELLVVNKPISANDWRIEAVIRRVSDAGGVGLLAPREPRKRAIQLCARLGVPLLVTTGAPVDLLTAARVLLAQPYLDRAALLLATHRELGLRSCPPAEAAEKLGRALGTPVRALDDTDMSLATGSAHARQLGEVDAVPQLVRLPDGEILLAHPALLPHAARPGHWLVVELDEHAADAVGPSLAFAVCAVERWLAAHRIALERDARWRSALLGELLRLHGEPTAALQRRAEEAGWPLAGWHIAIRIAMQPGTDNLTHSPDIARALRTEGVNAVVVEHGDGWTAWTTFPDEPAAELVAARLARLRAAHRAIQCSVQADLGVGRPHPDVGGLATSIAEAVDSARFAAAWPELGHFLQIDEMSMGQLLLEWARTDTFEPAARALVAPLQDAQGDLVQTVGAYLDTELSLADAAAALGVHRNTVADRIARVQTLLGVDLSHGDERLALHLACRLVTQSRRDRTDPDVEAH